MPYRCDFPKCPGVPVADHGMCELHRRVRVSGSWMHSRRHEDDGGDS